MTLSYGVFLILAIVFSLFAPLIFQYRHLDAASVEASEAVLEILSLHDKYWLPVLFTLIFIALHTLYATHKIAGPLYRFRNIFETVRGGTLPKPVRLRKDDFLVAESDALNAALESLRTQVGQMQSQSANLHEMIANYAELAINSAASATADDPWSNIQKTENQLHQAIHRFRIET